MMYFYAWFLFRQPIAGQNDTACKFQVVVLKDMWASKEDVCEGNSPLPIWLYILNILGNVLSTSLIGCVLLAAKAGSIRGKI